ncbi:MAG: 50S ribosomal protein L17 [Candidatus Curtissbacteria bacterium GW2011_GWA1_40_16]|uniref:50S ribosomal protein L17 n=1 Tax=Candidatus Curtissbacteria bacterium GW2011_GWA1_40_16 TaxID=1618405 RepID=A0A0G0RAZ0_9BACT|nr:MAG: 50S ribosomal protein L17 [Candidatus Curtissbacteria bacterium GW2011_GWA1_40_16]
MRHAVFGRKLGRDTNSRRALLNNLAGALIIHGSVTTTLAKAKFVKPYVEKMVTSAKKDKLASKRILASYLKKAAFKKLTDEIAPGFDKRPGGYARIIKLTARRGDSAAMAKLEFLEWDKSKALSSKTKNNKVEKKVSANKKGNTKKETTKKEVAKPQVKQKTKK